MVNKRKRSMSFTDDAVSTKRRGNETNETVNNNNNGDHELHVPQEAAALPTVTDIAPVAVDTSAAIAEITTVSETQSEVDILQTDAVSNGTLENKTSVKTSSDGLLVVAPEFRVLHDSWETFDKALKIYGKATYQLYVIRSTTSVRRRNFKIIESGIKGDTVAANVAEVELGVLMEHEVDVGGRVVERTLIPERFLWYSKSLKCTHGWKDRHRSTGKRGSGVVRSTSCPAKMCVTLQHQGPGPDDWKVVVTKHVRTHNHQLSKELYLYYTENRRIYDPELLAVVGKALGVAKPSNGSLVSSIEQKNQRTRQSRILPASDEQSQQQASSMAFMMSDSSASLSSHPHGHANDDRTRNDPVALSGANRGDCAFRPCIKKGSSLAAMPPLGAMVLTPGTILSEAIDGGGFCVPRVSVKVHASWDAFHDFIAQYSFDTAQVFRTRSTVSVAARNAKVAASAAAKLGQNDHDVASYASYAAVLPSSRLIPEEYKWFSKLLICTFGWKRRARGKGSRIDEYIDGSPCPAMLLARMERNVDGDWYIVINRQVQKHNHRSNGIVEETGGSSQEVIDSVNDTTGSIASQSNVDSNSLQRCLIGESVTTFETGTNTETSVNDTATQSMYHREIVVRVPKLQSVFNSWDDFHTSLKAYSDATYQLYRTRTTSSAKGRNKKIAQMKRDGGEDENDKNSENGREHEALLTGVKFARMIPEPWRWYSKTLTCTHGWKERHRGAGKRSAHGVRSTACPVKICATVQYMNPPSRLDVSDSTEGSCVVAPDSCWRVVITKHIVDHNHNLSRELYQHYCENRRIYDPELLAIDTSSNSPLVQRKVYQVIGDQGTLASDMCVGGQTASQSHVLSTDRETGLAEAVNHVQLFGSSVNVHPVGVSGAPNVKQTVTGMQTVADVAQQSAPPVVLDSYNSTTSYLPARGQDQDRQQQQGYQKQTMAPLSGGSTETHLGRGGESAVALTVMATPEINSSNFVVLNNAGAVITGGIPPMGSNVISVTCRVHGSLARANLATSKPGINPDALASKTNESDSAVTRAAQCTCFRIAGGGTYVTVVPASEALAPTQTSFDADDEAMLHAEDMDGVWQLSSHAENEKVTLEKGEMIWRVPRIVRRYSSWEDFHKYLDAYSAATFQLYRVRTTYSVRSRNVRLRQLAASRGLLVRESENDDTRVSEETEQEGMNGLSRAHLVPEQYEWYSKTFLCTHGWKRRSRGSGQRVSHIVRATECPAKICATLQRTDGSSKWSVVVTKHLVEHNHELSEGLYLQYSEVRRVRDPEVLAQAEKLWRDGATRRRVFEFFKERSPQQLILMKDVHNLVQRWQSQERRPREDQQQDSNEVNQSKAAQPVQSSPISPEQPNQSRAAHR
ncbi:hypothetical protein KXD40_003084 [Peronospora effusa]|nr:hypothetical protein KXD40_003084 [Peronospora effusa]CAI5702718.1 unnamed protein product [Peronospora effusa]